MMDKINDNMNANGQQKLSLDELSEVSGGTFSFDPNTDTCTINGGAPMTGAQFTEMVYSIASSGGTDLAVEWLHKNTGYWCSEMRRIGGNTYGQEAVDKMGTVMEHFWSNYYYGGKH